MSLADSTHPEFEITRYQPRGLDPATKPVPASGEWEFPAASVTALELDCEV